MKSRNESLRELRARFPHSSHASTEEMRRRRIRSWPVRMYPVFVHDLLLRHPSKRLVFLERDGLPLFRASTRLAHALDLELDAQTLVLNREMLPADLLRRLGSPRDDDSYRRRRRIIRAWGQTNDVLDSPLGTYVRASLAEKGDFVLVDTGFWGTIPLVIRAVLMRPRLPYRLVAGAHGTPALLHEDSEEGVANQIEHAFNFPFVYRWDPTTPADAPVRVHVEPHKNRLWEAEVAALDELVDEYVERLPGLDSGKVWTDFRPRRD